MQWLDNASVSCLTLNCSEAGLWSLQGLLRLPTLGRGPRELGALASPSSSQWESWLQGARPIWLCL